MTDVSKLVQVVMRQACDLLDADRATLFVVRTIKEKRELYTFLADGTDPIVVPIEAGIVGACVAGRSIINIPDAYEDQRFNRSIDRKVSLGHPSATVMVLLSHWLHRKTSHLF